MKFPSEFDNNQFHDFHSDPLFDEGKWDGWEKPIPQQRASHFAVI